MRENVFKLIKLRVILQFSINLAHDLETPYIVGNNGNEVIYVCKLLQGISVSRFMTIE